MGGMIGNNNNKRISMSSTLFPQNHTNNNIQKPSILKSFRPNRVVVGLGIVAALCGAEIQPPYTSTSLVMISSATATHQNIKPTPQAVVSSKSNPIPILTLTPLSKPTPTPTLLLPNHHHHHHRDDDDEMEMELSEEEYTRVVSHIGGGGDNHLIKKTDYFFYDAAVLPLPTHSTSTYYGGGDEVAAVKTTPFQAADFLKSCYLCDKHLHGLDIFMYRGEKAFCSAECRYEQMVKDERKEKEKEKLKKKTRGSLGKGATTMKTMMMNKPSFEFSSSTPCSSPIQRIAGIVAA